MTNVDTVRRPLAAGTLVAGRYRVSSQLGLGGMGAVYKARDEELGTDIALKVLRADLATDPEWIDRFRRELVLAREVTHKNVVRIHDIGESGGLRFLTMRLVEGRSLLDVIQRDGRLPVARALHILRQVAEALQQAHEAGVVHRDLKPGNILIAPDDTAYIADFGVARSLERDRTTRSGMVVGTLDYLSPEQAAGDTSDARSDLYSLGIVLFEMLTGQLPFRADSRTEVLAQRITGRPKDIADTGVRVPAHVRGLVRRCLQRRPERRYASVRELIADLDRGRARLRDRLPPRVAALSLVAVLLIGVAVASRPWRAPPLAPAAVPVTAGAPMEVAVLPLVDETGDASLSWVATGLAEMLAVALAEAPELRVIDSGRVLRTLRDVKLESAGSDEAALRRVAELLEVRRLVTGSVRRAGSTLRVDLRLVSARAVEPIPPLTLSAETEAPGGLFPLVSDLGERLRGELGAARVAEGRAPELETASVQAAMAYRQGRERLLVGDSIGAAPAFEWAVRADPRFPAALLGLSEAYQALGYRDKAIDAAQRAAESLGTAQTRIAWRARARLALLQGDPAQAEKAYAELARRFPNDTEAWLELAAAQASQGATAKAVVTLKHVTELDRKDPRAWFLLGRNLILAGDAREAVTDPLIRALALMTQLGNRQGQGDVLNAMGVAHKRLGEYDQAVARYGEAAAIRKEVGDVRGAAVSLTNRAGIHLATGRLAEAEADLRSAREVYAKIGDKKGLASVWNDFGALYEARGEYAEARKAYRQGLRIRRQLGDEQQLAQSYDNVGYIFFLEGAYDDALVYWRQALDLRLKLGDKAGIVLSTQNLGFLQIAEGRWPEAMKSFLDALEKGREIEYTNALAVSHGNIGLLHQLEGRYSAALAAYKEALEILQGLGDKRGLAEFTIKQATALVELGQLDEAKTSLDAVSTWLRETANHEREADFQATLGQWHLARGEADAARQAFARAVDEAQASRSRPALLRARIARAAALVALGEASEALPELAAAARGADALGDALLRLRAAEALARAELARARLREAEQWSRQALKLAERCGWEAGRFRLQALLGQVLEKKSDPSGAAAAYREAARRVAILRESLSAEQRASFDGLAAVREVEAWLAAHSATATR